MDWDRKREGWKEGKGGMIHFLWPVAFGHRCALLSVKRQPITSMTSCWAPVCFHRIFIEGQKKYNKQNKIKKSITNHRIWRGDEERGEGRGEKNRSDMYSKASLFRVALRAGSAVVAPDPLISVSINSCLHALFISYIYMYIYIYIHIYI